VVVVVVESDVVSGEVGVEPLQAAVIISSIARNARVPRVHLKLVACRMSSPVYGVHRQVDTDCGQ
jgi:hypothetical protein